MRINPQLAEPREINANGMLKMRVPLNTNIRPSAENKPISSIAAPGTPRSRRGLSSTTNRKTVLINSPPCLMGERFDVLGNPPYLTFTGTSVTLNPFLFASANISLSTP
jgi:hypothetical protein